MSDERFDDVELKGWGQACNSAIHINSPNKPNKPNRKTGVRLSICAIRAPLNFPNLTVESMQSLSMSE